MNVKEFKAWLNQFPNETEVEVLVARDARGWEGGRVVTMEAFDAEQDYFEFIDFTENPYPKPSDRFYMKKYLRIGGEL